MLDRAAERRAAVCCSPWRDNATASYCSVLVQITLYKEILKSKTVASLLGSSDTKEGVLHIITMLKKLCNHPDLLRLKGDAQGQLKCCWTKS